MEPETFIVQVAFDDHDSYYTLTKDDIARIMAEPDLTKRDKLLVQIGCDNPASVSSSHDVDLIHVIDEQPAEGRWADLMDQLED